MFQNHFSTTRKVGESCSRGMNFILRYQKVYQIRDGSWLKEICIKNVLMCLFFWFLNQVVFSNPFVFMGKFYDGVPPEIKDADFDVFVDDKFSKHFKVRKRLGSESALSGQRPMLLHCNEQDDI